MAKFVKKSIFILKEVVASPKYCGNCDHRRQVFSECDLFGTLSKDKTNRPLRLKACREAEDDYRTYEESEVR